MTNTPSPTSLTAAAETSTPPLGEGASLIISKGDAIGLTLNENVSYEEWSDQFQALQRAVVALPWLIGDLMVEGEKRFGEEWAAAIILEGKAAETLRKYHQVAARIPPEERRPALTYSAHQEAAFLPQAKRQKVLEEAEEEGLTTKEIRQRVKGDSDEIVALREALTKIEELPDKVKGMDSDTAARAKTASGKLYALWQAFEEKVIG